MEYAVSREGTTLVTLHEGTDTTARAAATEEFATQLEALAAADRIADWAVADADVYEHPTAPFDPYTITVSFAVTVAVEAEDADAAAVAGATAIDEALAAADADALSYTSEATASAAS
ncbi:hypothetical protein [Salinilacihabitans rarus]|uniref:hypothetical protein n=1 Tax=Salinilacihabitans rarus TaxID=2961596 RepID=UPI0020C85282|nr:hypothetical protein [Salinilacihabitans rarus]